LPPAPQPPSNQIITTVAGTGVSGYSGDGGSAADAELGLPEGVAADSSGNFYIADSSDDVVRKVDAAGIITTIAGNGVPGYSGDGGPAADAQLDDVVGVAADSSGNIFIADWLDSVVRKVNASGIITTAAGNGTAGYSGDGGPAADAELSGPIGVAVDSSGNLYIADSDDAVVRKVGVNGVITTVAGDGIDGYSGDGGPATAAEIGGLAGLAVDTSGNLYISAGNFATTLGIFYPPAAAANNGVVRKVSASGIIRTVAGNGQPGFSGDGGPATAAELSAPAGLAANSSGNLYIADEAKGVIREVTANGIIMTVAGSGNPIHPGVLPHALGDGGPATSAELSEPNGLSIGSSGNFYIADAGNFKIREVGSISASVSQTSSGILGPAGGTLSFDPPQGPISLYVPPGALAQNSTITLSVPASFACGPAPAAVLTAAGVGLDVALSPQIEPISPVTLQMSYPASAAASLNQSQFILARCDSAGNVWVPLLSSVNPATRVVTARTGHLSLFQIMQSAASSSVKTAKVFPNPWRISQGPAAMTFALLPANARLRIYTLSGLLVKELTSDSAGMALWDGTNQSGKPAASGFYFVFAQGEGGEATVRVAIQR
jgi:sugar lactone lactonase YvrE